MKAKPKSNWSTIKLTQQGRSKLRTAVREHPLAAQFVRSSTEISSLSKAGLLDLAVKLGIDYQQVLDAPEDEYPEIGSFEARTGAFAPKAFSGVVEFDFTMGFLGKSVTRRARVKYDWTPDWVYLDSESGREIVPFGQGGSFSLEIQSVNESVVHYSGEDALKRGRTTRARGTVDWEECNDLTELGIWTDEMWDAFEGLIDRDCRAQDAANRKRAQASPDARLQ